MKKTPLTKKSEILDAFEKLKFKNVELGEDFLEKYKDFLWYLLPHWRVGLVLYSVPNEKNLLVKPWESWYLDAGVETHHVHYAHKVHEDDHSWIQEEWTEERPDEVIGRYWYWYDDKDMKPCLLD